MGCFCIDNKKALCQEWRLKSRLISSQRERDFVNSNYDDIKQVFSIWLCMNMDSNSMSHIHFVKDEMLEPYDWKGKYA